MSDPSRQFCVLLDDPSLLPIYLSKVSGVVADMLGLHPSDATMRVRYGGGVIARNVLAPYARAISKQLAREGLGTFLVPQTEFRPAPRPVRTGLLELHEDHVALAPYLHNERKAVLPWPDVLAFQPTPSLKPPAAKSAKPSPDAAATSSSSPNAHAA